MGKRSFTEYIENHELGKEEETNWVDEKDKWLRHLNEFYDKVRMFLKDFIESKDVSIKYQNKWINEEHIGRYEVKRMILQFKGNEVFFEPIGTNLIGAKGRVDMEGSEGTVRFVLIDNGEKRNRENKFTEWMIATPPPEIKYIDLCEDSFFDSLLELINA